MELNLNLSGVKSVAVTEFKLLPGSKTIARVIATVVGNMDSDELTQRLAANFKGEVTPVRSSFRWLDKDQRSAIGYVRQLTPVRPCKAEAGKVEAGYSRITANLLMDDKDQSLWEVKQGAGGGYLARHGQDNLAELLEASRVSPRGSVPRMSAIVSASAAKDELVAFVDASSGSVDYGFCIGKQANFYEVLSHVTKRPVAVTSEALVGVYPVDIPANIKAALAKKPGEQRVQASSDTQNSIDYYTRLYSYAPEYLEKVIRQVEGMAAM